VAVLWELVQLGTNHHRRHLYVYGSFQSSISQIFADA